MRRATSALRTALFVAAAALVCACGGGTSSKAPPSHTGPLANPSRFPLYPGSRLDAVVRVDSAQIAAAMRANDPHADVPNVRGYEVIAETPASLPQLRAWLGKLRAAPPDGLRYTEGDDWDGKGGTTTRPVGQGSHFQSPDKRRSVFVVVAEPRAMRDALGPALTLIDGYNVAPGPLRAAIDDTAKKHFGYTVSDMLNSDSPVGAALTSMKALADRNQRAILIIDQS